MVLYGAATRSPVQLVPPLPSEIVPHLVTVLNPSPQTHPTPCPSFHKMLNSISQMQIKITMRYYFIPTRMTIKKKTDTSKCLQGCRHIETHALLLEMESGAATMGNNSVVLQKVPSDTI